MVWLNNFGFLIAALAFIVFGFVALSAGKLSIGPLLLVTGYCVLLPIFLWQGFRRSVGQNNAIEKSLGE